MGKRQYAHVKGELLVWARNSLRMGLEEAAERLGIPPERLAAWESGLEKATINQLRKAARVYKRPLAVFFLSEPPMDFDAPPDFRISAEQAEPAFPPELLAGIRLAHYRRSR